MEKKETVRFYCLYLVSVKYRLATLESICSGKIFYIRINKTNYHTGKVTSSHEPNGSSGRRLSRFQWHEATRSISMDGMLVYRKITPNIKLAGTHLYTWVERGTVRVKCLAREHNTMSPARARAQTSRSGVERTNHGVTALLTGTPDIKPLLTAFQLNGEGIRQ